MPDRFIQFMNIFTIIGEFVVTAATIIIVVLINEALYFIGLILMLAYWIGRLKREIETHHDGNLWQYIKYWFKKKKIIMPEELAKQASSKLLVWLLGIVATLIMTGLGGGFKFYTDWKADEAVEDAVKEQDRALMFDSPEQKEEHKSHVYEAPSALEQRVKVEKDIMFQEKVLEQLRQMSRIDTLNADQMYQIKQELEQLKSNY